MMLLEGIVITIGVIMCGIGSWFAFKFYKGGELKETIVKHYAPQLDGFSNATGVSVESYAASAKAEIFEREQAGGPAEGGGQHGLFLGHRVNPEGTPLTAIRAGFTAAARAAGRSGPGCRGEMRTACCDSAALGLIS